MYSHSSTPTGTVITLIKLYTSTHVSAAIQLHSTKPETFTEWNIKSPVGTRTSMFQYCVMWIYVAPACLGGPAVCRACVSRDCAPYVGVAGRGSTSLPSFYSRSIGVSLAGARRSRGLLSLARVTSALPARARDVTARTSQHLFVLLMCEASAAGARATVRRRRCNIRYRLTDR